MSNDTADQIETDARQHRQALREDLDAIFDRLSPGQIMDEALGQFGGAKSLTQNLAAQVRDNPMPVLVTAAGLAWLVSSSRGGAASGGGTSLEMHAGPATDGEGALGHVAVDPDDYDADFAARRVEIAEAGCVKLESESDEDFENRLARTRADALELDRAEGETDLGFRERVSDTAKKTREKASGARKRINDGAAKARKGIAGAAGSAKHGVQSAAGSAKHGAQSAAGSVKHGAQKASGATADAARSGVNSAIRERRLARWGTGRRWPFAASRTGIGAPLRGRPDIVSIRSATRCASGDEIRSSISSSETVRFASPKRLSSATPPPPPPADLAARSTMM